MEQEQTQNKSNSSTTGKVILAGVSGVVGYILGSRTSTNEGEGDDTVIVHLPVADLPVQEQQPLSINNLENITFVDFDGFAFTPIGVKTYVDKLAQQADSERTLGVAKLIALATFGNYVSDYATAGSDIIRHNVKRRYASICSYSMSRGKSLENEASVHVLLNRDAALIGSAYKPAPLTKDDFSLVYPGARNRSRNKVSNPYAFLAKGLNTLMTITNDGSVNSVGNDVLAIMSTNETFDVFKALNMVAITAPVPEGQEAGTDILSVMYALDCNIYVNPYSNLLGWMYGPVSEQSGTKFSRSIKALPW